MKSIVINNRSYRYPDRPEELTIEQWQQLMGYAEQQSAPSAGQNASGQDIGFSLLKEIVGIAPKILLKTDPEDRKRFLTKWSSEIGRQSAEKSDEPEENALRETAKKICKKQRIAWPQDTHTPYKDRKPLAGLCAQALCEATDLYLENHVKHAPLIASILCHPANRPYDEQAIIRRADNMRHCSMKIMIALFNELTATHQACRKWFPGCYGNRLQETRSPENHQPVRSRWNDMLLWLADYRPSEIRLATQLPWYDFMHLLDCKLRNRQNTQPPKPHPFHV